MITANQTIQLAEDYLGSVKTFLGYAEVFINPTKSDFLELSKSFKTSKEDNVRFIADGKAKKFYAWNAEVALHKDIRIFLNLPTESDKIPHILFGESYLSGQSLKFLLIENIDLYMIRYELKNGDSRSLIKVKNYLTQAYQVDWKWLDKYLPGSYQYILQKKVKFENLK